MFLRSRLHLRSSSSLLMRYPTRLESFSTITSCTSIMNDNSSSSTYSFSNGNGNKNNNMWSTNLREKALFILQSEPTTENIKKLRATLSGVACPEIQAKLVASSTSNNNNSINIHEVMLLLSLCYQTGATPSEALLSKTEFFAPQLLSSCCSGSPQYLMLVIGCYEFFAPHRLSNILELVRPSIENAIHSLRASELAILICQYSNYEVFHNSTSSSSSSSSLLFYETLLERIVMLCNDFSVHEISQISLALVQLGFKFEQQQQQNNSKIVGDEYEATQIEENSTMSKLFQDVREAIEHDLGQRFVQMQELSTLRDATDMLWSVAMCDFIVGNGKTNNINKNNSLDSSTSQSQIPSSSPLLREIEEACARRIYAMVRDMNCESFSKTLSALPKISLKTPRLLSDIGEISTKLDFSALSPIAALDTLSSAAELGLHNIQEQQNNTNNNSNNSEFIFGVADQNFDSLFGRLTARIMSGRSEILRNDAAREKLLSVVEMLK